MQTFGIRWNTVVSPRLGSKVFPGTVNPNVGQLTQLVIDWKFHETVIHRFVGCNAWKFRHCILLRTLLFYKAFLKIKLDAF